MKTLWLIAHRHNPMLFYAQAEHPFLWTQDERAAMPFTSEDAALTHIVGALNGEGQPVMASFYAFEGDRLAA